MDPLQILKQFKNIEPDKDYTRKSRFLILHSAEQTKFGFWKLILKNTELGTAVALTGLLIFMILGGFSAWSVTSPLGIANLDPAGLKAEAQAIDIQIELTNLNYSEDAAAIRSAESTPKAAPEEDLLKTELPADPTTPDTTSTSNAVSIDEALQKLSE
ncbi:MAG: hypothetical protein Q7R94_00525 [bacterium]|nr:hypothetical protein [bacterium]